MKNGIQNSRVEIYLGVIRNLLDDLLIALGACESSRLPVGQDLVREIARDFAYIRRRTTKEGLSFLTITMPALGKWYDEILATRDPGDPLRAFKPFEDSISSEHGPFAFARSRDEQWDGSTSIRPVYRLPVFARSFYHVLSDASIAPQPLCRVVRLYRTLFYLFYKLEVPFSKDQLTAALLKWKAIENELEDLELCDYYDRDLIAIRQLVGEAVGDRASVFVDIRPQHGPGAVAGGEKGEDKWSNPLFIHSLHRVYPYYRWWYGLYDTRGLSPTAVRELSAWKQTRKESRRAVSKLTFVPKDSRGPRTICMEPKELMFVQQGVARNLMRTLHRRTDGHINFIDQTVNAELALRSSRADGVFATVDMEDASDRVSLMLVRGVFPEWTYPYLEALRSSAVRLPDGTSWINLQKYAPMGSALCFPVESVIFWAIAVHAVQLAIDQTVAAGLEWDGGCARDMVYVYGDDIVIHRSAVTVFRELCRKFGLKLNLRKTYVHGPFRESCGTDALMGFDVTPLKVRKDIGRRSLDGNLAQALCDIASECFHRDWWNTGKYLKALVEREYGFIPYTLTTRPYLSVVAPDYLYHSDEEWERNLDYNTRGRTVKAWVLITPKQTSTLADLSRMRKSLQGNWAFRDPSEVVVSHATKIRKRNVRWAW